MERRNFLKTTLAAAGAAALPGLALADPTYTFTAQDFAPRRVLPSTLRLVEKWTRGGWQVIGWPDIKQGTIFRLRDPDGSLVDEGNDFEICIATADAVERPDSEWYGVDCEKFVTVTKEHPLCPRLRVTKGDVTRYVRFLDLRNGTAVAATVPLEDDPPFTYMYLETWFSFDAIHLLPA